jgi:hypothetical protein
MKAVYKKPITEFITCKCENMIAESPNTIDHGDAKKGFFDEDDALFDIKKKNLWDDEPIEE